jgi:hypothetical protein
MSKNAVQSFSISLNSYTSSVGWTWTYQNLNEAYYNYFRLICTKMSAGSNFNVLEFNLYGVGQYLQNNPITSTYNLTINDAIPILSSNTTTITGYFPTILNGTYMCSSSSINTTAYREHKAFDLNVGAVWGSLNNYNTSGVYIGPYNTTINTPSALSVSGEWLQIKLPYSLSLTGYSLLPPGIKYAYQSPKQWYLTGSNDGISWDAIDYQSGIAFTNIYLNFGNSFGNKNYYSYFRLVIMSTPGTTTNSLTSLTQVLFRGIGK